MKHSLIFLSILILSPPLFGLSKGSGVLFFVMRMRKLDGMRRRMGVNLGNISGILKMGNQTDKEKSLGL